MSRGVCYNKEMTRVCLKCGDPIIGRRKEAKYCSARCSKLYLKAQWKKRTIEHQRAYQRQYRQAKNGGNRPPTYPARYRKSECLRCGSTNNLQGAHVKPLWAGGTHEYIITLCQKCHYEFDNLLRDFWRKSASIKDVDTPHKSTSAETERYKLPPGVKSVIQS